MWGLKIEQPPHSLPLKNKSLAVRHQIVYHRTIFEDWPEPERRQHLRRLWPTCKDGLAMPRNYEGEKRNGRPNGIEVTGVPFKAALDAEQPRRRSAPRNRRGRSASPWLQAATPASRALSTR